MSKRQILLKTNKERFQEQKLQDLDVLLNKAMKAKTDLNESLERLKTAKEELSDVRSK